MREFIDNGFTWIKNGTLWIENNITNVTVPKENITDPLANITASIANGTTWIETGTALLESGTTLITTYPIMTFVIAGATATTLYIAKQIYNLYQQKEKPKLPSPPPSPPSNKSVSPEQKWLEIMQHQLEDSLNQRKQEYLALVQESERLAQDLNALQEQRRESQETHEKELAVLSNLIESTKKTLQEIEHSFVHQRDMFEKEEENAGNSDLNLTFKVSSAVAKKLDPTQAKLPKEFQAEIHRALLQKLNKREMDYKSLVQMHKKQLNDLQEEIVTVEKEKSEIEQKLSVLKAKNAEVDADFEQNRQTIIDESSRKEEKWEVLRKTPIVLEAPIPPEFFGMLGKTYAPLSTQKKEGTKVNAQAGQSSTSSNDNLVEPESGVRSKRVVRQ